MAQGRDDMKGIGIFSLLLGLAAVGLSVFAKVETWGNFTALVDDIKAGEATSPLEMTLVTDYASTLDTLHIAAWACGGLALVLGIVAMAKTKKTNLVPGFGALLGVAGVALSFLTMP